MAVEELEKKWWAAHQKWENQNYLESFLSTMESSEKMKQLANESNKAYEEWQNALKGG